MPIPVDSGCIPVESGLIPVDSSGFQWNPVIPAGMVGGVTSTVLLSLSSSSTSACPLDLMLEGHGLPLDAFLPLAQT